MAHQMSPEQIEEYKKAFSVFDKDGDGKISTDELGAVLGSIGQRPSQAELEEYIREINNDGNGMIEFEKFLEMMTCIDCTDTERKEVLMDAFRVFDKDGNGFITVTDLRQVMKIIGDKLPDNEIEEIIREIVIDGDVMVNYEDFLAMMTQQKVSSR